MCGFYVKMYNFSNPSGKCVNVRLMIETWWGSRETARATAKPQIEFSRLGDNPHPYLKTYLSLKQKKISFVWNFFGSSRYFWDYIVGPVGGKITQLSSLSCLRKWCHCLHCLLKSDKRRPRQHIYHPVRERGMLPETYFEIDPGKW